MENSKITNPQNISTDADGKTMSNKYLYTQLQLLKFISIWPLVNKNLLIKIGYRIISVIRTLLLISASIAQVIQIFYSQNLTHVSSAVDIFTLTTSASYKIIFVILYQNHYKNLLDQIDKYFIERPVISWNTDKESGESIITTKYWAKNTSLYSLIYTIVTWFALGFWGFTPMIEGMMENYNKNDNNNSTINNSTTIEDNSELYLPLNAWLPFNARDSPIYQIVFLIEVLIITDSGMVYMCEDSFFFTMIYLLCGQLQIIKDTFNNMKNADILKITNITAVNKIKTTADKNNSKILPRNNNWMDDNKEISNNQLINYDDQIIRDEELQEMQLREEEEKLFRVLVQCINHHQKLLSFLRQYEKLSQSLIITDFIHAIISLSFALFEASESGNIIEYAKMVAFVFVCIFHQFLNNYFGELVIQQQLTIGEAAYNIPWENYSKKFQSSVKIIILRSQTPIILNGLKMYFLCYKTFMEFMKALISYFMVLRQLQDDAK